MKKQNRDVTAYTDGCDLHDHCLTCPLPACRYEMPPGKAQMWLRAVQIAALVRQGHTRTQIANMQLPGISRRMVYRLWPTVESLL